MMNKILQRKMGFTLPEAMVAAAILIIISVALLGAFYNFYILSEALKERSIAIGDARKVLEEIREVSYTSLSAVTGTDWAGWAANNGCDQLAGEAITVNFTGSDPLAVTLTVGWAQRRPMSITITTLVTMR